MVTQTGSPNNDTSETNQTGRWHWSVTRTGSPNDDTGEADETSQTRRTSCPRIDSRAVTTPCPCDAGKTKHTHKKPHIHFNNAVTSIYDDLQLQLPTGVTCWSLR